MNVTSSNSANSFRDASSMTFPLIEESSVLVKTVACVRIRCHLGPHIGRVACPVTKLVQQGSDRVQRHSRSWADRSRKRERPQLGLAGAFRGSEVIALNSYLRAARNAFHAAWPNGSSGLSAVLESRTRTLPPSWPTSTHAPPLPPLRLDLRHCGSRVSIARSPLFGSGRGMPPGGALPIVLARILRGSWSPGSAHR